MAEWFEILEPSYVTGWLERRETEPPTLEEMQKFVGGYIEVVTLADGSQLVLNEEGKLDGRPLNVGATVLAHRDRAIMERDVIVGPVLHLCGAARLT